MISFVFWDVQHGSACYINTPNNKHFVIDLGTGSYGNSNNEFSPIKHLKYNWNIDRLDSIIITHPHRDHLDDIFNLNILNPRAFTRVSNLNETEIRSGNRTIDSEVINKYFEILGNYNFPIADELNPFLPSNNGNVQIKIFNAEFCPTSNLNNHSLVILIEYAGCKIMIPGDNESSSWEELLENNDFLASIENTNILVAPHHGRESGYYNDLFNYIEPYLTIVSDGRFCDTSATNRYSQKSKGWNVHKRSGRREIRKCLTTRNDGVISVKMGLNTENHNYIQVEIN